MDKKNKVGAFLTGALVATIAGGYFLFGSKNARQNRQRVEDWMADAKREILETIRNTKNISEDKYDEIVDLISDKYAIVKGISEDTIEAFKESVKEQWKYIEEEAMKNKDKVNGGIRKTRKKIADAIDPDSDD
jgi:gas vesicle protein